MQSFSDTDKTIFTFIDKFGEKSTLTLDKHVADALQNVVGDIHAWIQTQYDAIDAGKIQYKRYINAARKHGEELSRLAIGNIIRLIATVLAFSDIDDSAL